MSDIKTALMTISGELLGDLPICSQQVNFTEPISIKEITNINDDTVLKLRAKENQTANICEIQSSTSAVLSLISSTGLIANNGVDTTEGNGWNIQQNGFRTNSATQDTNFIHAVNGVDKWAMQTYRGENGEFWYLYSVGTESNPITVSNTGRVGINKETNILQSSSLFTGTGLNDLVAGGVYTKSFRALYQFIITSTGTPNQFQWRKSTDYGVTWSSYSSNIACAVTPISIENGITVQFGATTGHTLNDMWQISAAAQLPSAAFTVNSNHIDCCLKTPDYTSGSPTYTDHTYAINTTSLVIGQPFSGSTTGAIYLGSITKLNSTFWTVSVPGTNITMVAEYWNGSTWVTITEGTNNFADYTRTNATPGTSLSQSGRVFWDKSTMTDWVVGNPPNMSGSQYTMYWVRFRTSTVPSVTASLINITRGTNFVAGVYAAPWDYLPAFALFSNGRVGVNVGTEIPVSELQVSSASTNAVRGITSVQFSSDTNGARIGLRKSRGTAISPTSLSAGDNLGSIIFTGYSGSSYLDMASIDVTATGTVGSNRIPTQMSFKVATNADPSVLTERCRIWNDGGVTIGSNFSGSSLGSGNLEIQGSQTKINGFVYTWPSSQGSANSIIQNNGSGTLLWYEPVEQWVTGPISATSPGIKGQMSVDGTYLYMCITTGDPNGSWVRWAVERAGF